MNANILNDYAERIAFAKLEAEKFKKLANNYSLYRLVAFVVFILCVAFAISIDDIYFIGFSLIVLILCFSWLVKSQSRFDILKNYWLDIIKVNENEIASINAYANMYDNGALYSNDKHYYTSDLDIFGTGSLYQMINRAATFPGMNKLAQWLGASAPVNVIKTRQEAVREIAEKNDWKIDMQANLLFSLKQQREQIRNLLSYLKIPVELKDSKLLSAYSKIAPWFIMALIIYSIFYSPVRYLIPMLVLFNYRLVSSRKKSLIKQTLLQVKSVPPLPTLPLLLKILKNRNGKPNI